MAIDYLETTTGQRIAHHRSAGATPGIVFLGGFTSDMTGAKATHLQAWAKASGRAFLRFDYSGHGASSGDLQQGCISDWAAEASEVINAKCDGPQILVGSSMGGWISLLLARRKSVPIAGFVGVAAAPDFTEVMRDAMSPAELDRLGRTGRGYTPDTRPEGDFEVWSRLLDDPAALIFPQPLSLSFPVRLVHGTADEDVPVATALHLLDHATGPDIRLTLIKGADHRLSTPGCLELITTTVQDVIYRSDHVGK